MKHTQEEIVNALQVIKDTCKERYEGNPCGNCPLSKNGDCVLQNQPPEDWKIKPSAPIWRAFE